MRIGDDDDRSFFGEPRRGGLADAATGGGRHDRYLVLKSLHLSTLLAKPISV